jgi:hypothetical protein
MKSGFIALPTLQVLQFLSISFETEDETSSSRVAIDFLNLPRMKSIAISGWKEDNLLLHGRSQSVERLEMHDSLFGWTHFAMLANLGSKLREILVSRCNLANYYWDRLQYIRTFQPAIFRLSNSLQIDTLELDDSTSLLPLLLPATLLSLKQLIIRLGCCDRGFDLDDLQSFLNELPSQLGSAKFDIHIDEYAFSPDGDLYEFPISCERRFLSGGMSQQFIPSLTRLHPDAI